MDEQVCDQFVEETIALCRKRFGDKSEDELREVAYLAGFFDGNSSLRISSGFGRFEGEYPLTIQISHSNREIVDEFANRYGGQVKEDNSTSRVSAGGKRLWFWICPFNQQFNMLSDLYPFLKIKQPEVMLSMVYLKVWNEEQMKKEPEFSMRRKDRGNYGWLSQLYLRALSQGFSFYSKKLRGEL